MTIGECIAELGLFSSKVGIRILPSLRVKKIYGGSTFLLFSNKLQRVSNKLRLC